jgi:hypothetical protein
MNMDGSKSSYRDCPCFQLPLSAKSGGAVAKSGTGMISGAASPNSKLTEAATFFSAKVNDALAKPNLQPKVRLLHLPISMPSTHNREKEWDDGTVDKWKVRWLFA